MNLLHPAATSTRQLSYDAATNRYVGEISSTNGFGRVYADACDEGLTLVSARTGVEIVFVITGTDKDAEGEIVSWTLVPAIPSAWGGGSILLFND